jgi:hypothetical protein
MAKPKDQIRQWELAALAHLNHAAEVIALSFRRRLHRGATVEAGRYTLTPETFPDDLKQALRDIPSPGLTAGGLDIDWDDPAKAEPKAKGGRWTVWGTRDQDRRGFALRSEAERFAQRQADALRKAVQLIDTTNEGTTGAVKLGSFMPRLGARWRAG